MISFYPSASARLSSPAFRPSDTLQLSWTFYLLIVIVWRPLAAPWEFHHTLKYVLAWWTMCHDVQEEAVSCYLFALDLHRLFIFLFSRTHQCQNMLFRPLSLAFGEFRWWINTLRLVDSALFFRHEVNLLSSLLEIFQNTFLCFTKSLGTYGI